MSARLRKHAVTLKALSKANPGLVKTILRGADKQLIYCLCECASNILKGNVPLNKAHKSKLQRHKTGLRHLAKKSTSIKRRKRILQKGGFLGALLAPLASILAPIVSKVFS